MTPGKKSKNYQQMICGKEQEKWQKRALRKSVQTSFPKEVEEKGDKK